MYDCVYMYLFVYVCVDWVTHHFAVGGEGV